MSAIIKTETSRSISASVKVKAVFVLFLAYVILVTCYTVLLRSPGIHDAQFELFWSYKKWLAGDWGLGREILGNIVMFIPFGFLLSEVTSFRKKSFLVVVTTGMLFSCVIEFFQFELMRGLFEYDDIVNNTLGAVLGYLLYKLLKILTKKKTITTLVLVFGVVFVLSGLAACISDSFDNGIEKTNYPRSVCFQIDKAELNGNKLTLIGFAFYYEREMADFGLVLKSAKTGKVLKATVQYGLHRPDVEKYFSCAQDLSNTGFTATVSDIHANEEYEVFINAGRFVSFPTGVYVTGNHIHYVKQEGFIVPDVAGTDLEEIVKNGYLRVYRPDQACYVYQYNGFLYWIADKTFNFEDDGTTYIQYQLWTTQVEKLPQKRLNNQWYWDNIGGYFEKFEITNSISCGRYRVCRRKIPDDYSIMSIVTGYYKKGNWIWRSFFRPVYEW